MAIKNDNIIILPRFPHTGTTFTKALMNRSIYIQPCLHWFQDILQSETIAINYRGTFQYSTSLLDELQKAKSSKYQFTFIELDCTNYCINIKYLYLLRHAKFIVPLRHTTRVVRSTNTRLDMSHSDSPRMVAARYSNFLFHIDNLRSKIVLPIDLLQSMQPYHRLEIIRDKFYKLGIEIDSNIRDFILEWPVINKTENLQPLNQDQKQVLQTTIKQHSLNERLVKYGYNQR